uniref:Uncharacterized protein n=1 Tax=Anguilla anguilla TaxID=7936 RepID=A0A0E9XB21_ANGAN
MVSVGLKQFRLFYLGLELTFSPIYRQ